jgi:hypothetical protein
MTVAVYVRKKSIFVKNCSIYENLLFALPELFTRSKHPNQKNNLMTIVLTVVTSKWNEIKKKRKK